MVRKFLFRLASVLIGIAATLLIVEAVLQTASGIVKNADRHSGRVPTEGELRIACVGESTTFGLWPSQLEEILNEGTVDRRIRVINRGVVGIRTDGVASQIEGWLDEDQPHLVITMLGINDEGNVLVYPRGGSRGWLAEHSKTARLASLLWRSAFDIGAPGDFENLGPSGDGHLDDETRERLAHLEALRPEATESFRISELIEIHRELIVTDPGTPFYHLSYLKGLVLHHDQEERLGEFFSNEIGVDSSMLSDEQRLGEVSRWAEQTGDVFAALRIATSIARARDDTDGEEQLLEAAVDDPEISGVAWLRMADFASRHARPELSRQSLLNADNALPDDYQWAVLLGDISFMLEVYDLAAAHFHRALTLRPDLPASHELLWLGQLANACDHSGDADRATAYRAQRDELELGRFRHFTRFHYRRVVDSVRARRIPVIAMQYPLLSVESLRKLLDYREDVTYLENRTNFKSALGETSHRELFEDNFAGAFGHLSPRGNSLVAANVATALAGVIPELAGNGSQPRGAGDESP